ncbi:MULTISPECIES: shikimate kinase [unclassified Marinobacter]|uniref:shikimate kinase n=1 Tax=unclassified Marinobacter TaxID=83889 RepID=UPI00200D0212|nr:MULTISPECIES: shikimate kinase [unclassified Marinobacter]UQG55382.1 shikimate kinase [Marinobacter sp. M4C]UQG64186.1 shikimate kinase [Marinobacter sp. M2C]UQG68465.1 shikimate kinase [Marinobacter sp. M1C]
MTQHLLLSLGHYHPVVVVVEGMGGYDPRDPVVVAAEVSERIMSYWGQKQIQKPKFLITQGDSLEGRGISAITPLVAARFGLSRGLVCLDERIAEYHSPNADRDNVILELKYSQLVDVLNHSRPGIMERLERAIDDRIERKSQKRKALGENPLKDYFRDFALLQEVTKAACSHLCRGITVAHTSSEISEFSVTSFYTVGLELGLVDPDDMVP